MNKLFILRSKKEPRIAAVVYECPGGLDYYMEFYKHLGLFGAPVICLGAEGVVKSAVASVFDLYVEGKR